MLTANSVNKIPAVHHSIEAMPHTAPGVESCCGWLIMPWGEGWGCMVAFTKKRGDWVRNRRSGTGTHLSGHSNTFRVGPPRMPVAHADRGVLRGPAGGGVGRLRQDHRGQGTPGPTAIACLRLRVHTGNGVERMLMGASSRNGSMSSRVTGKAHVDRKASFPFSPTNIEQRPW